MKIPFIYSWKNLQSRTNTTVFTVAGVALVVFVFASVLMMAYGVEKTMSSTGSADNVKICRKGSNGEISSIVPGEVQNVIRSLPFVAKDSDGTPLVSTEPVVIINLAKKTEGVSNIAVRGVSPSFMKLRPELTMVEGRMFDPALRELIVGKPITERFRGARIGDVIKFANVEWKIVGVFTAGGSGFESEMIGNSVQLLDAFNRGNTVSSVTLKLDNAENFDSFMKVWGEDIRLKEYEPETEIGYYEKQTEMLSGFIRILGIFITVVFSIGATVGAMITMYGAVANRTIEIGVLRSLGFSRRSILIVFLVESMVIALIGSGVGLLLASFLQFFTISTLNFSSFSELAFSFALSPSIIIGSLIFGVTMGFFGGFLPAARAARMNIVSALRAA